MFSSPSNLHLSLQFCLQRQSSLRIISSNWAWFVFLQKLKKLKPVLKAWNEDKFGIISSQKEETINSISSLDATEQCYKTKPTLDIYILPLLIKKNSRNLIFSKQKGIGPQEKLSVTNMIGQWSEVILLRIEALEYQNFSIHSILTRKQSIRERKGRSLPLDQVNKPLDRKISESSNSSIT